MCHPHPHHPINNVSSVWRVHYGHPPTPLITSLLCGGCIMCHPPTPLITSLLCGGCIMVTPTPLITSLLCGGCIMCHPPTPLITSLLCGGCIMCHPTPIITSLLCVRYISIYRFYRKYCHVYFHVYLAYRRETGNVVTRQTFDRAPRITKPPTAHISRCENC